MSEPRNVKVTAVSPASSSLKAEAWRYCERASNLVVIELRQADGTWIATVQMRVPHPRKEALRTRPEKTKPDSYREGKPPIK